MGISVNPWVNVRTGACIHRTQRLKLSITVKQPIGFLVPQTVGSSFFTGCAPLQIFACLHPEEGPQTTSSLLTSSDPFAEPSRSAARFFFRDRASKRLHFLQTAPYALPALFKYHRPGLFVFGSWHRVH